MKNRFLMLTIGLLLWAAPAPFLLAAEVTRATAIEISGKDAQLGVTFHARREGRNVRNARDEVYLVDIDVAGVKRLSARLDYSSQSLAIRFRYFAARFVARQRGRPGGADMLACQLPGSGCREGRLRRDCGGLIVAV